jgi:hypothetical protein
MGSASPKQFRSIRDAREEGQDEESKERIESGEKPCTQTVRCT